MFETLIYDQRDAKSDQPASTVGTFATIALAARAIANYLEQRQSLGYGLTDKFYRVEILPVSR